MANIIETNARTIRPNALLAILTTGHLVNDFYGIALPFLLPTLTERFDLSYFSAGVLAVTIFLIPGAVQPLAGLYADRRAWRKPMLLSGFLLFSLGLVIVGLSTTYQTLLIALVIFGLGKSTFHPQSTNLITRAFPLARGRAMGIHGIGGAIGNFSVPLLTTLLITELAWPLPMFLMAIPGLAMIVVLAFTLSEPPKAEAIRDFMVSRDLLLLGLTFSFIYMMYNGFLTFLPLFLVERGSTLIQAGMIAAIMLLAGFFAQPLGGAIYDRLGGRVLFSTTAVLGGGALWLLSRPSVPPIIPIIFVGAAVTATFPVVLAMGSDLGVKNVGFSVGFVVGFSSVLASFTPALTGYLADGYGLDAAFQLLVVFAFAALLAAQWLPGNLRARAG